tara:strand:+ start:28463 stop:29050 length:588 start_codon:yes stop_codon:yes gene_type:complete
VSYLPPVLRAAKALDYAVFDGDAEYDLNIIGVRNNVSHRKPDLYLDDLYVFWKQSGIWRCFNAAMTTTPGEYYLVHPMRPSQGCAIMAPGQYRGAYKRGLHKGKQALRQVKKVNFYRDNDRDTELDLDPSTLRNEIAYLNIHRGGRSDRVGRWSAGCQVLHSPDMDFLVELADKQIAVNGWESFTYTLLTEDQLK